MDTLMETEKPAKTEEDSYNEDEPLTVILWNINRNTQSQNTQKYEFILNIDYCHKTLQNRSKESMHAIMS